MQNRVKGLLRTTVQVSTTLSFWACAFCKEMAWGRLGTYRRGRTHGRPLGAQQLGGGSRQRWGESRGSPPPPPPQHGHGRGGAAGGHDAILSARGPGRRAAPLASPLSPLSPLARAAERRRGWGTCRRGPPGPRDAASGAGGGARLHHVGRAPPGPSRAGLRPGNLRAPAGPGGRRCPFRAGRYPIHPLPRGGRHPPRDLKALII